MTRLVRAAACTLLLAACASTQAAGYRDLAFTNPTGQGSSSLQARVYYPATTAGANTPMHAPPPGGYPVVVYLHGWSQFGRNYALLGRALAERGYVAVLNDNTPFNTAVQGLDGAAYFAALSAAATQPTGFLSGAIDMSRAGICGHSAGGGNSVEVLAQNPGYLAGFVFAPIYPGQATTAQVDVPLAVIHGEGDLVLLWQFTGLNVYNAATGVRGLRTLYLMDFGCGHNNLTGLVQWTATDQAVWQRAKRVVLGFFDRYLKRDVAGLDEVIGVAARSEPRLTNLYLSIESPDLFVAGEVALGQTATVHVASEPGGVLVAAADAVAPPVPTPFGDLQLATSTAFVAFVNLAGGTRFTTDQLPVPNVPALVGASLALQAIGNGVSAGPRFTRPVTLVVGS